ncbi:S8 family peptidase [Streptomyces sp. NBC_00568]|uniref:S8 family peptidase n=1 Tax=Streptomyces sp. NBC_00568 TaxID=2975779 RepID=UPI00225A3837|nr:S8 family peptidase [Streptomyces sp. NBC_00568]MCX4993613.1 S8 family peptidase [Streptomyces sp. NBC_00568]
MQQKTFKAYAVLAAALLSAGLGAGAAADTANGGGTSAPSTFQARQGPGKTSVVTLITGDKIHLSDGKQVTRIERAKGREGILVSVRRANGATYAIPSDAAMLVDQGKLDRRLFNVSALVAYKYDDAHRTTLPFIVSYTRDRVRAKSAMAAADVSVRRDLPAVGGEALTARKSGVADVWQALTAQGQGQRTTAAGIERVWLDGQRRATLDKSVPQVGAPSAWQAGYEGTGVKVAVLDTGVDETHPDLKGVEAAQKNFSEASDTVDRVGHGTHVASTVAGSGAKSGGSHKGVAPGARILDAKVLDDEGFGSDSGILAGMQWAVDQGAKVVNLSLGMDDTPEVDPLEEAVNTLSAESGTLFVVAAGNSGPEARTLGSPGSADSALTVGAVDRSDKIADFSSVGPTANGSLKPDITGPGVGIVAAKAAQGTDGDPARDGYVSMSGTSMATPHVTGAAAVLAQEHPDWTGQRIKQALTASAKPGDGLTAYQQGAGRADLTAAITQTVVSEQASVSFGTARWPHPDDKPKRKTITYNNLGPRPVRLDLSLESLGPDGKAAPAGFFTLGANQITVPARGTASVDLTSDTRAGSQDGFFSGAIVATAAGTPDQRVRTAFGAERETESYQLSLKYIDAKGKPAQAPMSVVYSYDGSVYETPTDPDGNGIATLRVPRGDYLVSVPVYTPKGDDVFDVAQMTQPRAAITGNTTLTFDARKAKPVNITAPGGAKEVDALANFELAPPSGEAYLQTSFLGSFKGYRTAQVGAPANPDHFRSELAGRWENGAESYHLLYPRTGSLHTGFTHTASADELALVKVKIGSSVTDRTGWLGTMYRPKRAAGGAEYGMGTSGTSFKLPTTRKSYISTPQDYTWEFSTGQEAKTGDGSEVYFEADRPRTYEPKKTYAKTFNVGVFSPMVDSGHRAERIGDVLSICIPEFTDGAGHFGSSTVTSRQTFVTVDGKKVVDTDEALCGTVDRLPDTSADYRIRTTATRSAGVARVSSRISALWTFTSKKPADDAAAVLPLSTVRFTPKLDLSSAAPAGSKFQVPMTIQGPAAGQGFKSLTVHVSYDAGKSWSKTPVLTGEDNRKSLLLSHPKTAKSASFKALLTDKDSRTYEVIVINAYQLK